MTEECTPVWQPIRTLRLARRQSIWTDVPKEAWFSRVVRRYFDAALDSAAAGSAGSRIGLDVSASAATSSAIRP
jgi:hypothetical protein